MKAHLSILKIGGQLLAQAASLDKLLRSFTAFEGHKILVHGGGRRADELLRSLDIQPRMLHGRRITDAPTLEIVTMVYAGLINKSVVAQLQALGCPAIGLSGADADLIRAHQRIVQDIDYGYAGDIDYINTDRLRYLLDGNLVPVCCAITHDGKGQLLNTNADTIASRLAVALAPHYHVILQYCLEKPGVLADATDDSSVIARIDQTSYATLKADQVITDGMIPKLDNAFDGLQAGVAEVRIGNPESLSRGTATCLQLR